ncbi:sigma-70 family RNA polymerase sigma factor [Clostridium tagluense]|uniref:sigma-70 family RNA polymerase sigma factor n=1 Tax=Clostridium tagluense TaxID=360422 RepID=UPI001CF4898B|nr:sigma-70 family RNA polymerase sigma factor [Clostridium tagluense]MCB2297761.1 sigma-70 family RNA polymerase sigma factor [Clostridium tagluense]
MKEELIQEFKNGNKRAGDDFYSANMGLVCTIAKKYKCMNMDQEEVKAIVNQAFAHAMKNIDLEKAMFSTYFGAVAHGMILRHCRDFENTIRTQRKDILAKKIVHCDSFNQVIHQIENEDITLGSKISSEQDFTSIWVDEALNKLNKKDRQAFKLQLSTGLSQTQIAEIIGTTQMTVSRRIARAKSSLKILLKEVC